ncbi:uncharacterized protein CMC5_065280 [Chondromyces crocatus]|uniref:Uncharacterized protein n=1 Tax=Chondromyces crocatus TaxID=52 RepID=A0A0K1EN23_CHOCO|nr:uncharacterized protein CMC5_065280 [Chondromyces crocatus]
MDGASDSVGGVAGSGTVRRGRCLTEPVSTGNAFLEMSAMRDPRAPSAAREAPGSGVSALAVALSVVVHAALFGAVHLTPAGSVEHAAVTPLKEPADVWVGDTAALPGPAVGDDAVHEVELDEAASSTRAAPVMPVGEAAPPAAAPSLPEPPVAAPPPPPVAAPPPPPAAPKEQEPAHAESPSEQKVVTPKEQEAVPQKPPKVEQAAPEPKKAPVASSAKPAREKEDDDPYAEASPPRPSSSAEASAAAQRPAVSSGASDAEGRREGKQAQGGGAQGAFGAEGVSGVRSLGRAFTRAIPPACQADPAWRALPAGSAGIARIVVEIDGEGHVAGWKPEGTSTVPAPLAGLARRTLALLRAGVFAMRGSEVVAGSQTLEISAEVLEGAAGDDLAWKFEDGQGRASFIPTEGRRIDVRLRVLRATTSDSRSPG